MKKLRAKMMAFDFYCSILVLTYSLNLIFVFFNLKKKIRSEEE